jgi:hypothetical protein
VKKSGKVFRKTIRCEFINNGFITLLGWKRFSQKKYAEYCRTVFRNHFNKSYNGDHNGIAQCVYTKYRDRYVCSDLDKNVWWEFKNHKWVQVSKAYTLKLLLSDDFANEYNMEIIRLSDELIRAKWF